MAKNLQIFLTRENKHIQETNRHFDGILNHFGRMISVANQENSEFYSFKEMLLQPEYSYFILDMIKDVGSHEGISNWTLMK